MRASRLSLLTAVVLGAGSSSSLAQQYDFTVSGTGNNFTGNVNVLANFNGSLIGQYLTPPTPVNGLLTRTIPGAIGGDTNAPNNLAISPIVGNVNTSGNANTRPTGTFILKWTPDTLRVDLYQMSLDVLGTSADPSLPVNVTITNMPAFRTRDPNYSYPNIPNIILQSLTLPLGSATLTSFTVVNTAPSFATAAPAGGGSFTFSMSVPAQGDAAFTLNGQSIPTSVPQVLTVTGVITPGTSQASLTFGVNVVEPVPPTPADPPPVPFPVGLPNPLTLQAPNANVLFTLFFTGGNTTLTGNVTTPGSGGPVPNLADLVRVGGVLGADGQLTLDDLLAFVNAFGEGDLVADVTAVGGPPLPPDGQLTLDDLLAFVNAFGGG